MKHARSIAGLAVLGFLFAVGAASAGPVKAPKPAKVHFSSYLHTADRIQTNIVGPFPPTTALTIYNVTVANLADAPVAVQFRGIWPDKIAVNYLDCVNPASAAVFDEPFYVVVPARGTMTIPVPDGTQVPGHYFADTDDFDRPDQNWCLTAFLPNVGLPSPTTNASLHIRVYGKVEHDALVFP